MARSPVGWEEFVINDSYIPPLGDANEKPLALLGKVMVRVRFCYEVYLVALLVADTLAVPVISGTCFMRKHIVSIRFIDEYVQSTQAKPAILATHSLEETFIDLEYNETREETTRRQAYTRASGKSTQASQNFHKPNKIRVAMYTNSRQGLKSLSPLPRMNIFLFS